MEPGPRSDTMLPTNENCDPSEVTELQSGGTCEKNGGTETRTGSLPNTGGGVFFTQSSPPPSPSCSPDMEEDQLVEHTPKTTEENIEESFAQGCSDILMISFAFFLPSFRGRQGCEEIFITAAFVSVSTPVSSLGS